MRGAGAHGRLRAATAGAHAALDARISALDMGTAEGLAAFLRMQDAALPGLEMRLEDGGFAALCPGWAPRRAALRRAMGARGLRPGRRRADGGAGGAAALWGIAYVLEGARLGGRVIARQAAAGEVGGAPEVAAFLDGRGPLAWRDFTARLDAALGDPADLARAEAAARAAFGTYADALAAVIRADAAA